MTKINVGIVHCGIDLDFSQDLLQTALDNSKVTSDDVSLDVFCPTANMNSSDLAEIYLKDPDSDYWPVEKTVDYIKEQLEKKLLDVIFVSQTVFDKLKSLGVISLDLKDEKSSEDGRVIALSNAMNFDWHYKIQDRVEARMKLIEASL